MCKWGSIEPAGAIFISGFPGGVRSHKTESRYALTHPRRALKERNVESDEPEEGGQGKRTPRCHARAHRPLQHRLFSTFCLSVIVLCALLQPDLSLCFFWGGGGGCRYQDDILRAGAAQAPDGDAHHRKANYFEPQQLGQSPGNLDKLVVRVPGTSLRPVQCPKLGRMAPRVSPALQRAVLQQTSGRKLRGALHDQSTRIKPCHERAALDIQRQRV